MGSEEALELLLKDELLLDDEEEIGHVTEVTTVLLVLFVFTGSFPELTVAVLRTLSVVQGFCDGATRAK